MGYFIKTTGLITYNAGSMEYYNGVQTVELAKVGAVSPVVDSYTTAGSAGPYPMAVDYAGVNYDQDPDNPANVLVFLDGIYQPTTAYTVASTDLTFTVIPPSGLTITIIHGVYSTNVPFGSEF